MVSNHFFCLFFNFEKNCLVRLFGSFVRSLVRLKIFQKIVRADAIELVQKSSNFEPYSRFFGRLKIFEKKYQNVPIKIGMSIAIAIGFVFLILFILGGAAWGPWAQAPSRF